jgi:uncharacterized membrane protein
VTEAIFAAPSLAVYLLANYPPALMLNRFRYNAAITPFVIIASAYGLGLLARGVGRVFRHVDRRFLLAVLGSYMLVLTLFYHQFNGQIPLACKFASPETGEHERADHRMIE